MTSTTEEMSGVQTAEWWRLWPTGLAAAFAASAVILAGCGSTTLAESPGSAADQLDIESVEARADRLYEMITGGAVEREAIRFLQVRQLNEPYEECLASAGYTQDAEFRPLWTGYRANGTSGSWLGATFRKPSAPALAIAATTRLELEADTREEDQARDLAEGKCSQQDGQVVDLGNKRGYPKAASEVKTEFQEILDEVDSELGSAES